MAQHLDSRSRFDSIATLSLRAAVKLVQVRRNKSKSLEQRSEVELLPRVAERQ